VAKHWLGVLTGAGRNAESRKRFALVIGNSSYEWANVLPNPGNDASAIAAALQELGFSVTLSLDATRKDLDNTLQAFSVAAKGAAEILFYYCGHALQVSGKNYLVPVDANLVTMAHLNLLVRFQEDVLQRLSDLGNVKLFFLDACRNDPFEASRARFGGRSRDMSAAQSADEKLAMPGRGLATEQAGLETLIGFAALPTGYRSRAHVSAD
jgi:uncharacterized caspase-like protein